MGTTGGPNREGDDVRKPSLSKQVSIFLAFCAATAIASPAQAFTTVVSFDGVNNANPTAPLIQGNDGNFYGTTFAGGIQGGNCANYGGACGTVFKMTSEGTLTTLHNFDVTDGSQPYAGLVQATDGNFYGTTIYGGANDYGTVFKITAGGRLTTLHSFDGAD